MQNRNGVCRRHGEQVCGDNVLLASRRHSFQLGLQEQKGLPDHSRNATAKVTTRARWFLSSKVRTEKSCPDAASCNTARPLPASGIFSNMPEEKRTLRSKTEDAQHCVQPPDTRVLLPVTASSAMARNARAYVHILEGDFREPPRIRAFNDSVCTIRFG